MTATVQREPGLEWCVAARPCPGEVNSGDLHHLATWEGGALAAVVDGLGHGEEATVAAKAAVQTLETRAQEPLITLVQHCHAALRDTRGVVMTLVAFDAREGRATTLAVGNVEAIFVRADGAGRRTEHVLQRGGVVGYQLPPLQVSEYAWSPGDVLVLATDGVREDFADLVRVDEPLPQLVERILAAKFRGSDDGLVLACKHRGSA